MLNRLILVSFFLLVGCSHLFYQPSRQLFVDPAKLKLTFEDVYFTAKDGTKLHGWLFPARTKEVKGTIVQFHGNAQNISTHFLSLIWVTERGYNQFIFDYRGYGGSAGEASQAGVHQDALAALTKGRELWEQRGQGQFIVYGQSLGSVISMRAVSDFDQSKIDLVVQDSPFYSYKRMAFDTLCKRWFLVPLAPLGYFLVSNNYASKYVLSKVKVPTLVITGDKDDITPPRHGRYVFKHIGASQKWWWKVKSAGHIDVYFVDGWKYRDQFMQLLASLKS